MHITNDEQLRVKVFYGPAIYDHYKEKRGSRSAMEEGGDTEAKIDSWLEKNLGVEIVHIMQSQSHVPIGHYSSALSRDNIQYGSHIPFVTITVFYKEKAEEESE